MFLYFKINKCGLFKCFRENLRIIYSLFLDETQQMLELLHGSQSQYFFHKRISSMNKIRLEVYKKLKHQFSNL